MTVNSSLIKSSLNIDTLTSTRKQLCHCCLKAITDTVVVVVVGLGGASPVVNWLVRVGGCGGKDKDVVLGTWVEALVKITMSYFITIGSSTSEFGPRQRNDVVVHNDSFGNMAPGPENGHCG